MMAMGIDTSPRARVRPPKWGGCACAGVAFIYEAASEMPPGT